MIRTKLILLAVVAGILMGSAAFADSADGWIGLNGLTVGNSYMLRLYEPYSYTGGIQQYKSLTGGGAGVDNIAVGGGVAFCLPSISVLVVDNLSGGATNNPFWGVCIDTHEWSTSPEGATLKQGWTATLPQGTMGRDNGTVLSEVAWDHTTYLFNKFGGTNIESMSVLERAAFQLATWEVMSGDGNAVDGGNWTTGLFRAQVNQADATAVFAAANTYVKAAYDTGFGSWNGSQALYFSGAFQSGGNVAYQDYLVAAPAPADGRVPVPEIPAVALGPLGLMVLGLLKRRFVK